MPIFNVRQGLKAGEAINLQMRRIVVGRSNESTLLLPDESVDLTHASLEDRGNRWILQDLGAPGGTWLNDEEVDKPCRIFDGDVIQFGSVPVEVQGVGGPLESYIQPRAARTEPVVEPAPLPIPPKSNHHLYQFIILLLLVSLVGSVIYFTSVFQVPVAAQNQPPALKIPQAATETILAPNQSMSFTSHAQDQADLDRVEFWVNDVLKSVDHADENTRQQLNTKYVWSSERPGRYMLSVIAYDSLGQASPTVKITVIVKDSE